MTARDVETVLAETLGKHAIARPTGEPATWCVCLTWSKARASLTADEVAYEAHVAAEQASALRALPTGDEGLAKARDDIRARRREFQRLGAHEQYLLALDDAFGLVSNHRPAPSVQTPNGDPR